MDWAGVLNIDSIKAGLKDEQKRSTLDNRNTFSQIEYLADVYTLTKNKNTEPLRKKACNICSPHKRTMAAGEAGM